MMRGKLCKVLAPLKYGSVILFMVFSVLIILLHNRTIDFMSVDLTKNKMSATVNPKLSTELPKLFNICSFNSLSPKEDYILDGLKDAMYWPETPTLKSNFSLNDTSDPDHSTFTILPRSKGGNWQVGDQLRVLIRICDFHGHTKRSGGDVLFARLHNSTLHAGVAGHVVDHLNGFYSAIFPLLWEGSAQVEVTLVHPSEAVTVLHKLTQEQPDRIYFQSHFKLGSISETTTCNVCLNSNQQKLCNYTDIKTGEPWFCYKPKILGCDNRITHSKGRFRQNINPMEEKLFQSGVNMKVPVPASGPAYITVLPKLKDENRSTVEMRPSGYYYQGAWQALDGTRVHQFNSTAISLCLKGKSIHIYGDSTVRQWYEYLMRSLPDLKEFGLQSSKQSGPLLALDYVNNILVTFRSHGPPIRFGSSLVSQLQYIANELDRLPGGENTVVVIGIWAHFSTFPIEVYVRRLLNIREAVVRLLTRAPGTLVFLRTANPKEMTLYEALTNSDWFSLQRDKALREIFKGVNVKLVDAWDMVLAHHLPHKLHPQSDIIKNMLDVLLSYVCPLHGNYTRS
ncbi:NXPE family member 3-like [Cyprinodon tularosa]|uniref:NXPE family member 3-like n=1 Tax=Cyprinodon tularosa TaxID=77115 RepID=UPI0018E22123|nr:NXPE family member 3-like [Cyprinodon tularosa]